MTRILVRLAAITLSFIATAVPALAHHAMGGKIPTTLWEGLVTGVAHPVIGLDHLAFTVAVGLLVAVSGAPLYVPLLFVGGTLLGCLAFLGGLALPGTEWLILLSVLVLGIAVAAGHRRVRPLELGLFAAAGLFHGMAYAEGIIGSETAPLVAYLVGFAAVQAVIAVGIAVGLRALWQNEKMALPARLAGAAVAGIGFTFAFEAVESLLLPPVV